VTVTSRLAIPLTAAVKDRLGLGTLDLVYLRMTDSLEAAAIAGPFSVLAGLQQDGLIRHLGVSNVSAEQGIAFVPFFPLGGFRPLQSGVLDEVAAGLSISRMQAALAWLLQRSPSMLLIPGTRSAAHLRENFAAAGLELPAEAVSKLNSIGTTQRSVPWGQR
jgi:pyridoxine 4-dehydrogenase